MRTVTSDSSPLLFMPLRLREVSAVDGMEGGWELEDSLRLADLLRDTEVDLVDCSSSGLADSVTAPGARNLPRSAGFQVPYAAAVKRHVSLPVMAVGLILTQEQGEAILDAGDANMIAISRGALNDPNWPEHARQTLDPDQAGTQHPAKDRLVVDMLATPASLPRSVLTRP